MKFPQSFIDEVRAAADIVTVISDSVSLRKAGAKYKGLCPFHGEKTPSFTVDKDKGFFHCFGCGVGGDVFKFVELQDKVNFGEALRTLAGRFGIPIPELEGGGEQRESAAEREALVKIHEIALAYFREQLAAPAGARWREYLLKDRGLTEQTIDELQIGWAPPARDALRQRLLEAGFKPVQLVTSGLVTRRDDGTEIDRFRNRLMIPIARDTGTVIAFGGRALEADQQPKYLNSPETPIYTKSRTLYGLNLTKATVRKGNFALIVEGYFDFAQVHQAGGFPVIATCGTALTTQQAQTLRRFTTQGGALLRRRSRRPDGRRAQLRAAGKRRLRRQRSSIAGRRGPRHVHPETRSRRVCRPAQTVASVSGIPARSRGGRARSRARRQPA